MASVGDEVITTGPGRRLPRRISWWGRIVSIEPEGQRHFGGGGGSSRTPTYWGPNRPSSSPTTEQGRAGALWNHGANAGVPSCTSGDCTSLLLLGCTVLQTVPGVSLCWGRPSPVLLLPLALAVAVCEDEFSGALFGAVCGLMWDYTAGRTVGLLALTLMGLQTLRYRWPASCISN